MLAQEAVDNVGVNPKTPIKPRIHGSAVLATIQIQKVERAEFNLSMQPKLYTKSTDSSAVRWLSAYSARHVAGAQAHGIGIHFRKRSMISEYNSAS